MSSHLQEVRLMLGSKDPNNSPKKGLPRLPAKKRSSINRPPNFGPVSDIDEDDVIDHELLDKTYRDPNGPYTHARQSRFLLFLLVAWCLGLTLCCILLFIQKTSPLPPAPAPIFAEKKEPSKWHIPFNLVPDEDGNGRLMTLKLPQMTFAKLLKYDVCCKKGPLYACRAVSKNIGVEGYITSDGKALMHIYHPDMVGAQCTLMWIEKRE